MSATPTNGEIRRRLERQVIDDVLDRLTRGESRRHVIEALLADGFAPGTAEAYVDRVLQSPEGHEARALARRGPSRWSAVFGWGRS
jgi:hypothetical protein